MLDLVGIPQPDRRVDDYPHQFSGGMRQRAMIAMSLVNNPRLLIADEPTTALDVTVQAQILDLIQELQKEFGSAVVMITHDLGVIAEIADDVLVMYAGRCVEKGTCRQLLTHPEMPYTWGLLGSIADTVGDPDKPLVPIPGTPPSLLNPPSGCSFHPRCVAHGQGRGRPVHHRAARAAGRRSARPLPGCHLEDPECDLPGRGQGRGARVTETVPAETTSRPRRLMTTGTPLLEVENLQKYFPVKSSGVIRKTIGHVQAVDGVTFTVDRGTSLGLVGESGCGKTTTGRVITRLYDPTAGTMVFEGTEIGHLSRKEMLPYRREIQLIFQDPYSSLNPRHTVGSIVGSPIEVHQTVPKNKIRGRVQELLEVVGLNPEHYNRYPSEFSGGQRQRIGIARALALNPKLIVADEPVSALDVSIQAQVVNLLRDLQKEFNIAFLFIAHDLAIVRHFCPQIAVMYLGKIVEIGDRDSIYNTPHHPYTQALLSAAPDVKQAAIGGRRERIRLVGDVPSPINPPSGCRFRTRCWKAQDICAEQEPPLLQIGGRQVACHFAEPLQVLAVEPAEPAAAEA